jgi:hypothetical protein
VIADVVSYAIAGIGFIYAAGRLFVRKGSALLALRFALCTGCLRQATKVHFPRTRVEGLALERLDGPREAEAGSASHRQASTPAGWKLMTLSIAFRSDGRGP